MTVYTGVNPLLERPDMIILLCVQPALLSLLTQPKVFKLDCNDKKQVS